MPPLTHVADGLILPYVQKHLLTEIIIINFN